MKWKCANCMYGPCVYESYNCREYDDINPKIEKCPRGMFAAIWLMTEEEPEQKRDSGLPEWLMVGNFVVFDTNRKVLRIEGYDVNQHTIFVASRNLWEKMDRYDVHCGNSWGKARVVFPKPYTFETAPVAFKVRRKADGLNAILDLGCRNGEFQGFAIIAPGLGGSFVSFADALRVYEQLDGWPCGTFDGEDEK